MSRVLKLSLAVALVLTVGTFTAWADIVVFTNQPSWLAQLSSVTTEDFNDGTLNPGLSIVGDDVTIPSAGSYAFTGQSVMWDMMDQGTGVADTTFSFLTPITAFGGLFDLAGPGGEGTNITVLAGGVTLANAILNSTYGTFWGLTSTVAFDQVIFAQGTECCVERYELENLQYGSVPEPASILELVALMSLVGGFGWLRRKRT